MHQHRTVADAMKRIRAATGTHPMLTSASIWNTVDAMRERAMQSDVESFLRLYVIAWKSPPPRNQRDADIINRCRQFTAAFEIQFAERFWDGTGETSFIKAIEINAADAGKIPANIDGIDGYIIGYEPPEIIPPVSDGSE